MIHSLLSTTQGEVINFFVSNKVYALGANVTSYDNRVQLVTSKKSVMLENCSFHFPAQKLRVEIAHPCIRSLLPPICKLDENIGANCFVL